MEPVLTEADFEAAFTYTGLTPGHREALLALAPLELRCRALAEMAFTRLPAQEAADYVARVLERTPCKLGG